MVGYTDAVSSHAHIAPGSRGEAVRELKERLASLGHPVPATEAPDEFGTETEALVRTFQLARGLRVDGVCGPQTWAALVDSSYGLGDRLISLRRPLLRGDDVAELQRRLNSLGFDAGKEDGIFGSDSERAVREFQRNAGLTVDGICGPETVGSLARVARNTDDPVTRVREREELRLDRRGIEGRRVFLAVDPELEALGELVHHGLAGAGATVVVEPEIDDQSAVAAEANDYQAELVVLLRLGDQPGVHCAFFESGAYRSERGSRAARRLLEEISDALDLPPAIAEGKTYAVLRETRAPAVVCEPAEAKDVDAVRRLVTHAGAVGHAVVRGIRRACEDPPDDEA